MTDIGDNHVSGKPSAAVEDSRNENSALSERVLSLRLPQGNSEAGKGRTWIPWSLCVVLAASSAYLGFLANSDRQRTSEMVVAPETDRTPPNKSLPSSSMSRAPSSGEVVLESKGYIIPAHQIQVSPKVNGMVEQLLIVEGQRVEKGQVLAQLETVDYQADRDHTRSALDAVWQRFLELYTGSREEEINQAKAELQESEAQRKQLYQDYRRNEMLKNGALAARDYEQAESAYKSMDRRVERLRQSYRLMIEGPRAERIDAAWAEVLQAEADLTKAEWRLSNCTVRAPVAGTILTKKAEVGNIVNPVAFNISASLCDMADLSDLEVDLTIQERDISKVLKGQRCQIRPEAFADRVYEGTVSRLMPIADRAKGAIPVRVKVAVPEKEEGYLKPEMGVVVSFLRK